MKFSIRERILDLVREARAKTGRLLLNLAGKASWETRIDYDAEFEAGYRVGYRRGQREVVAS